MLCFYASRVVSVKEDRGGRGGGGKAAIPTEKDAPCRRCCQNFRNSIGGKKNEFSFRGSVLDKQTHIVLRYRKDKCFFLLQLTHPKLQKVER